MRIHEILMFEASEPFSAEEIERVKELMSQGLGSSEISRQLGRSINSVSLAMDRIDPNRTKREKKQFSAKEIKRVKALMARGQGPTEISRQLSRSAASIFKIMGRIDPNRTIREKKPFTDEEIELVKALMAQGQGSSEIARQLGRLTISVSTVMDRIDPNRSKREKKPFSSKEIEFIRNKFVNGTPLSDIANELENRDQTAINSLVKRMPDYQTRLLPARLKKVRRRLVGVSQAEINFFKTLEKITGIPEIKRNVRLSRGGRFYYNIDGIADNVAIEFFGSLWHADPTKYADDHKFSMMGGVTVAELRERDRKKIEWLEEQGYKVVVIWELEWMKKSTRQACIDRVLAAFNEK